MSRKDYELIAAALADSRPKPKLVCERSQWAECVLRVANALQRKNDRFDRDRFIEACND